MAVILLADDDDGMRTFIQNSLLRAGYQVKGVKSGIAALKLLKTEKFDLLVTDVAMPEMNGLDLAKEVSKKWPEMPIIFITGFSAMATKCPTYKSHMNLLSKPFHLNDLIQQIDITLNTKF